MFTTPTPVAAATMFNGTITFNLGSPLEGDYYYSITEVNKYGKLLYINFELRIPGAPPYEQSVASVSHIH